VGFEPVKLPQHTPPPRPWHCVY